MRVAGRMVERARIGLALVVAIGLASLVIAGHATTAPPDVAIALQSFQFVTPNMTHDVTIPVGTRVTWTNNDPVNHTATSDMTPTPVFDSGVLSHGASFSFVFNQAGLFPYHCIFHGSPGAGMHGTITVVPAPTVASVAPTFGGTGGGTRVTISGTNFEANATVTFGGVPAASVTVFDGNTIAAVSPPNGSGNADIIVTNPDSGVGTLSPGFFYAVINPLPATRPPANPQPDTPLPLPVRRPEGPQTLSTPNPLPGRQSLGSNTGGAAPAPLPPSRK